MKRVRIYKDYYKDYLIDDENDTLSENEIINKAYDEMKKETDREMKYGWVCLNDAEIVED